MRVPEVAQMFFATPDGPIKEIKSSSVRLIPKGDLVRDAIATFYSFNTAMAIRIPEGILYNPNEYGARTGVHQSAIRAGLSESGYHLVGEVSEDRHFPRYHGGSMWGYDPDTDRPWHLYQTREKIEAQKSSHLDYHVGHPLPVTFKADDYVHIDHTTTKWEQWTPTIFFRPLAAKGKGEHRRYIHALQTDSVPPEYTRDLKEPMSAVIFRMPKDVDARMVYQRFNAGEFNEYLDRIVDGLEYRDESRWGFTLNADARRAVKSVETRLAHGYMRLTEGWMSDWQFVDAGDYLLPGMDSREGSLPLENDILTLIFDTPKGTIEIPLNESDRGRVTPVGVAIVLEDELRAQKVVAENTLAAVKERMAAANITW